MPKEPNYYEILGVPRSATNEQIKKRYRELARKYHPDVVKDKAQGQERFVLILEAYKTLIDPSKRASYNLTLPRPETGAATGGRFDSATYTGHSPSGGQRTTATQSGGASVPPGVASLLRDAQFSFVKGRFNESANLCRQAIKLDRESARAHAILGDVYRAQGKIEKAIDEYSYAVHYDPDDRESRIKIEQLTVRRGPYVVDDAPKEQVRTQRRPVRTATKSSSQLSAVMSRQAVVMNVAALAADFALMLFLMLVPGKPLIWFATHLELVNKWSVNLIVVLSVASALSSAAMMASGLLEHPDEELVFDGGGGFPVGLPLVLFGGLFFWAAAGFYLLLGTIQGSLSNSILRVFAVVTVIVLLAGLLYPNGSVQVWLFGGNVAFICALAGWYIAAMTRPLST